MLGDLRELETRLRSVFGAWSHYQLLLWQQYRSVQSAGVEDRIRVAKEVLAATHRGDWVWALGGWWMLLGEIRAKLTHADPHIRADAAVALAEFGSHARSAVPLLYHRLRSGALHERALAAWVLPKIGADGQEAVPILLQVLDETADQTKAGELRLRAAEAVESLTDSFRVLVPLARRCLADPGWKSRVYGLALVERLGERNRRLLEILLPSVKPLLDDEVEELREDARRIVDEFVRGQ